MSYSFGSLQANKKQTDWLRPQLQLKLPPNKTPALYPADIELLSPLGADAPRYLNIQYVSVEELAENSSPDTAENTAEAPEQPEPDKTVSPSPISQPSTPAKPKPTITFGASGLITRDNQAARISSSIMSPTLRFNIPGISGIRIGGGLDFAINNRIERLTHRYRLPDPPQNTAPAANAGSNITLTLPDNQATLDGSLSSDTDGTITAYLWTQVSGPADSVIADPEAATTSVTGLQQGVYIFQLQVTDDSGETSTDTVTITVNAALPPPNLNPVASAGNDQTITLPTNYAALNGGLSSDADGTIASYLWTKVSGPAGGAIASPNTAATNITGLLQGDYIYQLQVTDDDGATATDTVKITVNPAPNLNPVASAGNDQTITLPTNSATLNGGLSSDTDGTIASYLWTKVSGPTGGAIASPNTAATSVTGLLQGDYIYQLQVTDDDGATATDTVKITVNPVPNTPPIANAGSDITLTLPTDYTTLNGNQSSDTDGTIASYLWTKVSGPVGGAIASPNTATTNITGLQQGAYVYQLQVTDNAGDTHTDTVTVTVNAALPPPNTPPTANAGAKIYVSWPTDSATLDGSASTDDSGIVSYEWTVVNAGGSFNITNSQAATTTVTGLQDGKTYKFKLAVTDDDGVTATDTVEVEVLSQLTKTGTISFPSLGTGDGHEQLYLTPTITPDGGSWGADFQESDITYEVTGYGTATGNVDKNGNPHLASSYTPGETVTITETFFYNGMPIAVLTITADAVDYMFQGTKFDNVTTTSYLPLSFALTKPATAPSPPPPLPGIQFFNDAGAGGLYTVDQQSGLNYADTNYTKKTLALELMPYLKVEIDGSPIYTPIGKITPALTDRLDLGLQWTIVDLEIDDSVPDFAVAEIQALHDTGAAFRVTAANKLTLNGMLDLLNDTSHISADFVIRNTSHTGSYYTGGLGFRQDLAHPVIQGFSLQGLGGFSAGQNTEHPIIGLVLPRIDNSSNIAGLWRAGAQIHLWPDNSAERARFTAGLEGFGWGGAVGAGLQAAYRPLPLLKFDLNFGWLDVTNPYSIYGRLAAQVFLFN